MSTVNVELIQFKRGSKETLTTLLVGDNILKAGEPVYEKDTKKLKIGDGVNAYADLPYIAGGDSASPIIVGYYLNNKFYTDSTYQTECTKDASKLYLSFNGCIFYTYAEATGFTAVQQLATDVTPGMMKLYKTSGTNEDGTMTQKAITEGVQAIKFAVEKVDTDGDGQLTDADENCLVLELPWTAQA